MGWFGPTENLLYVLSISGCDRDEDGRFHVDPPGSISTGFGVVETTVNDEARYYVNGVPCPLVPALNATSYGLRNVKVI